MTANDGRVYMVLVEEWSAADIEHNSEPRFRFKEWCLRTYGARVGSVREYSFDDPRQETLFRLKYGDLL